MDVYEKLYDIISDHFAVDRELLKPETDFASDLGADSLDVVELALGVEEAFDLPEMQETALKEINTIENLAEYILGKLGD